MDAEILAAVAAEEAAMAELLAELVEAPTLLGDEARGPGDHARARSRTSGSSRSTCRSMPAALAGHPGAAPFSWDVDGQVERARDLGAGGAGRRPLADPQRPHRRRQPGAGRRSGAAPPFAARRDGDWLYGRGAGDMKSGLVAMVGAVRGLQRLGLDAARPRPAAVGRRGGVHRQRRARVRARRPHGGRRDPHRADARRGLERAGRRALVPGPRRRRARPTPATRPTARTRSRRRSR